MPRGEPRSVPDLDGEGYDEMLRQERLKRAADEAAAGDQSAFSGRPYSVVNDPKLRFLFQEPQSPQPPRAPDDRTLDWRDTVQPKTPPLSPAELAAQRQALDSVAAMTDSPLAGGAYGVASLVGASPEARAGALASGAVIDATMMAAVPAATARPGRIEPPSIGLPRTQLDTSAIRYRELDEDGRAQGATATLSKSIMTPGTRANRRITPPGWLGGGNNQARAHLVGRQLGGTGRDRRNLYTMTHNGANTPQMRDYENAVARRVAAGEIVEYSATPIYGAGGGPPTGVLLTAHGPNGSSARHIHNPAGAPK